MNHSAKTPEVAQADRVGLNIILPEVELAARVGVCKRTLMRWRTTGEGPAYLRIGARRIGYRLADVEAWEAARTFPHRAAELAQKISAATKAA